MDIEAAEHLTYVVTSTFRQQLPNADIKNIQDYVAAGEWGVAYELLCTQLYEYDIAVDEGTFIKLRQLGEFGTFEPSTWEVLRPAG